MPPLSPDWLSAPRLRARGVRAVFVAALLSATGAGAAYALYDGPPPAAPGSPPPSEVAERARDEVDDGLDLSAPVLLTVDVPAPAPPAARGATRTLRAHHLRLPAVPATGGEARWIRWGNRLAARGHFLQALRAFRRAAAINGQSADAWYGVALCDYELGRGDAAATACTQALWADPTHAMGNLLAGFLSQLRDEPAEARHYYDRYLAKEPNGPYADELVSVLEQLPGGAER